MTAHDLARENLRTLRTLQTGAQDPGAIRLNANEAPDDVDVTGASGRLNRYPPVRPLELQKQLADLYAVAQDEVMVTRGSSEAIDVLMRSFCEPHRDSILVTAPTFELYRFFAKVQAADTQTVTLHPDENFAVNPQSVLDACTPHTKLIFLCSPNNPTGQTVAGSAIAQIAEARQGKSIVVVDEAYIEFSSTNSFAERIGEFDNVVVLRTLSKAYALAGARCGAALSNRELIKTIAPVLPPFSFSTPALEVVSQALGVVGTKRAQAHIQDTIAAREHVTDALASLACVDHAWRSEGNFVLFRLKEPVAALEYLGKQRILIVGYAEQNALSGCARVTIGNAAENDAFLAAMTSFDAGR